MVRLAPNLPHAEVALDIDYPFRKLESLDRGDFSEAAYEIFFTTCRSSPGFGGKGAVAYYNSSEGGDGSGSGSGFGSNLGSSTKQLGVGMAVTSRVKKALGLKMLKNTRTPSHSRRASSVGSSTPSSPGGQSPMAFSSVPEPRRRPLTSAEIMRRQMRVTDESDNRLRKTLMRTLVGQMGRRAETIILPLELLRHLKPLEFYSAQEYHAWQKRQLKILEAGLLLHPHIPLPKSSSSAKRFREVLHACDEAKEIDTGKTSELMKSLSNCVNTLSWRSADGSLSDKCHWADGYPLNIHIYMALLHAIFDLKEETLVLDEVDELLELMKKTWNTLGINRPIHNLCFTWVLFEQYIVTGQVEPDLIGACVAMLNEVSADAKKVDREPNYVKMLGNVLISMKKWAEKKSIDYHENFHRGTILSMGHIIPLGFTTTKILEEDVPGYAKAVSEGHEQKFTDANRVDNYICTTLQKAFTKMLEDANVNGADIVWHEEGDILIKLAKSTEDLFMIERDIFSPTLKIFHPNATGIAAVTLHTCYGTLLKHYLSGSPSVMSDTLLVLEGAGKLEKSLLHMVVEDSDDCEDLVNATVKEMSAFEVDSLIRNLLRKWIQETLKRGKEIVKRTRETEIWKPKSKDEPYAQTATELTKNAMEAIESFYAIPAGISENLVHELTCGLENVFREYITFLASCGTKQSYIPTLPPLTRCSNDSKFSKLLRRATCGVKDQHLHLFYEGNHPRPSTSRGTQRLYTRINTLHYLLSQLHSFDKTIDLSQGNLKGNRRSRQLSMSSYFDHTRHVIKAALQHVTEVAAYRLIFLDSNIVFYGSLYAHDVADVRIPPALRILKQNLTLLCSMVTDKAQSLAVKEVMKASFEAFSMVLLAGGSARAFTLADHKVVEEDFKSLKRAFSTCGITSEESVDPEAQTLEGVIALMGQTTEHLVEDFTIVACEASGTGLIGQGHKLPMPPTTGRWNRSDANTILRVLCHRNDRTANDFLKKTFNLARRRF